MHVIKERNINQVFPLGVNLAITRGLKTSPRGLETLEVPVPVASVYERPQERVLFDPERDANPFFHLMEALWILAGREDVAFLQQFNSKIGDYSDDGVRFHAAYGHRLRIAKGDQVDKAIRKLRREPNSRQVVLQIWDTEKDLEAASKDVPCNDLIMLKIRHDELYMTVCNRSNDIIWGCYGANVVQFSILQEYIAAMLGVGMGPYTQVSDSFHIYTNVPKFEYYQTMLYSFERPPDPYVTEEVKPGYLVDNCETFDNELFCFMNNVHLDVWRNSFFPDTAIQMRKAWKAHKIRNEGAAIARTIGATDWRLACLQWLARRGDV